jgi:HK97 family phage portal protein
MDFFQRLGRVGRWLGDGLRRYWGIQYPEPLYSEEAATPVTFDTAMQLSAVWSCVKLLAETVASLPLTVYQVRPGGRSVATMHPLSVMFGGKVNQYQTRIEFFETMILNLVLHGNAYAVIDRIGNRIVSLLPIMTSQVNTVLLSDGSVVHEYYTDTGVVVYSSDSIWHLKLMGNGIVGLSPLDYQRNTLGIAQGAEKAVTQIYKNGGKPSGVLSMDALLTKEQRAQIRANFSTLTMGTDERLLVLEKGAKFDAISLSPEDIELLESRKFQIGEICRWYGVPSVMVNDNNGTSVWGSGISQIVEGFYKITLRPLLEKIEASIDANLLGSERLTYHAEFDFDALLRSDSKSRYESYRTGIQGGFITPNEARGWENLPPMEGGDKLYMQGATVPIENAGNANAQPDQVNQ